MLLLTSSGRKVLPHIVEYELPRYTEAKVAYITTAAEPYADENLDWAREEQAVAAGMAKELFTYTFTGKSAGQIRSDLADADGIYVAGGNTFHLIYQAQKSGFGDVIRELLATGKFYIGSSAGMILLCGDQTGFEMVETTVEPDIPRDQWPERGLDFLNFTPIVHWQNPKLMPRLMSAMKRFAENNSPMVIMNDFQYIVVDTLPDYPEQTQFRFVDASHLDAA